MLLLAGQGLLALLFGFLVASANWVGAAAVLGGLAGCAFLLTGPRTLLIVLLTGTPTVFVLLNNYMHVIPVLTMERLLFALIMALVLAQIIVGKTRSMPMIQPERWMAGFLTIALLSLIGASFGRPLATVVKQDAALYVQAYFMPFAAFMLARRLAWSDKDLKVLGCCLLLAGLVSFVLGLLQVFLGVTTFVPTYMTVIHSEDRATGVFNNATEFGMVMNAFFLVALLFAVRVRDAMLRVLLSILAAAMFAGVLLSQTRATWVGMAASLCFLYVADRRLRPFLAFFALMGVVAAIFALPFLMETQVFQKRISDLGPIFNRLAGWATAVNMILHNPLLGVGFERGAFGVHIRDYLIGFGPASAQWATVLAVPHNEHLNVAVLTGLTGFVLYIAIYTSLFSMLRRAKLEYEAGSIRRDATFYAGAMLTSYIVNGVFVDFGPNIYIGFLVFACLGVVATPHRLNSTYSPTTITRARAADTTPETSRHTASTLG